MTSAQYTYQPPLTHKTTGPGLILVLADRYSDSRVRLDSPRLDPPPIQKWAEEGFCVLGISASYESGVYEWNTLLTNGLDQLKRKPEMLGERFGIIGVWVFANEWTRLSDLGICSLRIDLFERNNS